MPKRRAPLEISWATQRWLDLVESSGPEYSSRLAKGRTYFRSGHLWEIAVRPGRVSASVRGSYGQLYEVHLELPTLPAATWEQVIAALCARADYTALLLAGVMPAGIEALFAEQGASLFPAPGEIVSQCDCYDWSNPCKHVFALHYGFASSLQTDPLSLFALRGRTQEELVHALQASWTAADGTGAGAPQASAPEAPAGPIAPLRLDQFYTAGGALERLEPYVAAPEGDAALVRQLGRPPFARDDEDVLAPLAEAYATVTKRALLTLKRSAARHLLVPERAAGEQRAGDA
ncbi:MAG: hypothetical protein ACHQ4H_01455 [Ktedonobacterales bacterium]